MFYVIGSNEPVEVETFLERLDKMASNKLVVSDFDFDAIKSNLKTFLQDQQNFQTTILKDQVFCLIRYISIQHTLSWFQCKYGCK